MEESEVLYDAFKETYVQARKVYLLNVVFGIFALFIIIFVFRDMLLIKTFEPKVANFTSSIEATQHKINELKKQVFTTPTSYRHAKINHDKAALSVDEWSKNLPARKKMQQKYTSYLKEYTGNHDKVIERLKIDGEPGMELFNSLRDALIAKDQATKELNNEKYRLDIAKKSFDKEQSEALQKLEMEKALTTKNIQHLKDETTRIQQDKARLPWLGLQINPKDVLIIIPILLLIIFHALFDKFDELLTTLRKPSLSPYLADLKEYPLSIFLGRRNLYSQAIKLFIFATVPLLQLSALWLVYLNKNDLTLFGPDSWQLMVIVGCIACMVSIIFPTTILLKHKEHVFGK